MSRTSFQIAEIFKEGGYKHTQTLHTHTHIHTHTHLRIGYFTRGLERVKNSMKLNGSLLEQSWKEIFGNSETAAALEYFQGLF